MTFREFRAQGAVAEAPWPRLHSLGDMTFMSRSPSGHHWGVTTSDWLPLTEFGAQRLTTTPFLSMPQDLMSYIADYEDIGLVIATDTIKCTRCWLPRELVMFEFECAADRKDIAHTRGGLDSERMDRLVTPPHQRADYIAAQQAKKRQAAERSRVRSAALMQASRLQGLA